MLGLGILELPFLTDLEAPFSRSLSTVVWIFLSLSSHPGILYSLPPSAQPCLPFGVDLMPLAGERPNRLSLRGQGWSPVSCGDLTRGHPEVSFRADKRAAEPRVRLGRGCGAVTRGLVLGRVGGWMGRGEDLMDRGGADGPGPGVGGRGWMGWGWGQMDWGGSSMDRGGASIGWGRGLDGLGQGGWG